MQESMSVVKIEFCSEEAYVRSTEETNVRSKGFAIGLKLIDACMKRIDLCNEDIPSAIQRKTSVAKE